MSNRRDSEISEGSQSATSPIHTFIEIMTLKITLKILWHCKDTEITQKIITKEITMIIPLKYFLLLFKDTEIPLKNFQRYSFFLFPGFSAFLKIFSVIFIVIVSKWLYSCQLIWTVLKGPGLLTRRPCPFLDTANDQVLAFLQVILWF